MDYPDPEEEFEMMHADELEMMNEMEMDFQKDGKFDYIHIYICSIVMIF